MVDWVLFSMVGLIRCHVLWLCWGNNLYFFTFILFYLCILPFGVLHSNQYRTLSLFGFDINPKVFRFLCGPWWPAALFVWVHETFTLGDVFVDIGVSRSATMLAWLILCFQFLLASLIFLLAYLSSMAWSTEYLNIVAMVTSLLLVLCWQVSISAGE